MIHEVLFALSGFSGDIIIEDKEKGFILDNQLPFLHDSEKHTIQQLCQLGFQYKKLSDFSIHFKSDSLYIKGLCQGLNEILESYIHTIIKLEQEYCLKEEEEENNNDTIIMPLTYLKQLLRDYEIIFPKLMEIINQIKFENLRGALLLDFLYNMTLSGIPIVESCIQRLLFHCNVILMKQITSWMIYGIISNPNEFFIVEEVNSKPLKDSSILSSISNVNNTTMMQENNESNNGYNDSWHKQYILKSENIPTYLSPRVAYKILFIGKAIKVLQTFKSFSNTDREYKLTNEELTNFKEVLKVYETSKKFNSLNFEFTIDKIRMNVSTHLWNLVIIDCDLMSYFKAIRDFYFLDKGDFYLYFIEDSEQIINQQQQTIQQQNILKDFTTIFKQCYTKSAAEDSKLFEQLTIQYNKPTITSESTKLEMLKSKHWTDGISLEFKVKWPLNLFFTIDFFNMYNEIFQLLLTVKKIQCQLSKAWVPLLKNKKQKKSQELNQLLLLRSKMAHFIENLQFYFHVNVIQIELSLFEKEMKETKDFETAKQLHLNFLTKIYQKCFLAKKQIILPLFTIFESCQLLYELIIGYEWNGEIQSQQLQLVQLKVEQFGTEFDRNKNLLKQIAPFLFALTEND
ncbi:hypothetical protein ABK040_015027 [Willaertia magna]